MWPFINLSKSHYLFCYLYSYWRVLYSDPKFFVNLLNHDNTYSMRTSCERSSQIVQSEQSNIWLMSFNDNRPFWWVIFWIKPCQFYLTLFFGRCCNAKVLISIGYSVDLLVAIFRTSGNLCFNFILKVEAIQFSFLSNEVHAVWVWKGSNLVSKHFCSEVFRVPNFPQY